MTLALRGRGAPAVAHHEAATSPGPVRSPRGVWLQVLVVWAISRVVFFAAGAIGHGAVLQADVRGVYPEALGVLSYWAHWDGRWFAHIAASGYDTDTATAFFPLYPVLLRAGIETGLGVALVGVAVSTLATLAALYFVFELGRAWYGEREALAAIVILAFFPTSFYLNAVYSDALFLALSAGCVWALQVRRQLLLAGAFAFFAALTRNIGGLLILPLAYEWLRNRREFGWVGLAALAAPVLGFSPTPSTSGGEAAIRSSSRPRTRRTGSARSAIRS